MWKHSRISLAAKLKLLNFIIISVILYGCESWNGLKVAGCGMRRLESNCLRRMLKIIRYDHVSEEELRRRTGQQSVVENIKITRC